MISTSVLCSSFKQELLQGIHDFRNDEFKMALYTSDAILDWNTVIYRTEGEVVAGGYTAGGMSLTAPQVLLDPGARVGFVTFADPVWGNSQITARGALIYNQSKGQRAVVVLDFGADHSSNAGDFHVMLPSPGSSTALIRLQ